MEEKNGIYCLGGHDDIYMNEFNGSAGVVAGAISLACAFYSQKHAGVFLFEKPTKCFYCFVIVRNKLHYNWNIDQVFDGNDQRRMGEKIYCIFCNFLDYERFVLRIIGDILSAMQIRELLW